LSLLSFRMNISDKFSLKWNEFQASVCGSFKDVREDEDFSDVTLVSDDDKHMKANKVILAASSPVFRNIIKSNRHPHPIVFLRGFKSCYLEHLLDFIYLGEVQVPQEDLKEFLDAAEDLKINGLTEKSLESVRKVDTSTAIKDEEPPPRADDDDVIEIVDTYEGMKSLANKHAVPSENYPENNLGSTDPPIAANKQLNAGKIQKIVLKPVLTENNRVTLKRTVMVTNPANEDQQTKKVHTAENIKDKPKTVQKPVQFANIQNELNLLEHFEMFESQMKIPNPMNEKKVYSEAFPPSTLSELDSSSDLPDDPMLKMFSVKEATGYTCKSCGEFSNHRQIMKRHIQRNHMNDLEHGCKICGKAFNSRNRLSSHITSVHHIRK